MLRRSSRFKVAGESRGGKITEVREPLVDEAGVACSLLSHGMCSTAHREGTPQLRSDTVVPPIGDTIREKGISKRDLSGNTSTPGPPSQRLRPRTWRFGFLWEWYGRTGGAHGEGQFDHHPVDPLVHPTQPNPVGGGGIDEGDQ
ncbi:hypothetical protein BHE74_00000616 [Ensete ventricosum]|nr:hypothetical protein BHE74_00000616 [Ensete ventricosum]